MEKFIENLKKKYNSSVGELSKTGSNNKLIDLDFKLINFEQMKTDIPKINPKFEGNDFTTVDALFISNKSQMILHFIEFKNMDFNDNKDYKMSKYWLDKCINKMKECEYDCFILDENDNIKKSDFHKYLIDKAIENMRLKPMDSLSILYHHFKHINPDKNDEYCKNKIFNCEKYFVIVSKTEKLMNYPFDKNMSNQHMKKVFDPYKIYVRLEPFHYSKFIAINDKVFEEYVLNFIN